MKQKDPSRNRKKSKKYKKKLPMNNPKSKNKTEIYKEKPRTRKHY